MIEREHGPSCWAIHHDCAIQRIVESDAKLATYATTMERYERDVGAVERTKRYDQHWTTDCEHLGCRILRLRQHYDERRALKEEG